jgi:hypothetical protein
MNKTIKEELIDILGDQKYLEVEKLICLIYKIGEKNGMHSIVNEPKKILNEILS